jgi:hypothetical protein
MQTAYELRAIFRNITGTALCYGHPAGGSPNSGECASSGNAFYFLPSPALTANASQRLTTIRWFLNAGNGDVSFIAYCQVQGQMSSLWWDTRQGCQHVCA